MKYTGLTMYTSIQLSANISQRHATVLIVEIQAVRTTVPTTDMRAPLRAVSLTVLAGHTRVEICL